MTNTSLHAIQQEIERVTQRLAGRLQELTERYATPLPEMEQQVDVFASTVKGHLQQML